MRPVNLIPPEDRRGLVVGCYVTMAMLTRSFGMQLEQDNGEFEGINALRTYT